MLINLTRREKMRPILVSSSGTIPVPAHGSSRSSSSSKLAITFVMFLLACSLVFVSLRKRKSEEERSFAALLLRHHADGDDKVANNNKLEEHDLVIVPGHAIFIGDAKGSDPSRTTDWLASDFIRPLLPRLPLHIARATSIPAKLLVFSGGQTSSEIRKSEAQGYLDVARNLELLRVNARVAVEEHSRDSFENLLNSLCIYRKEMGTYPVTVAVVGFDFKRQRFSHEHARQLGIAQFTYVGMDVDLTPLYEPMEISTTIPQFQKTPFGCGGGNSNPLTAKRLKRDPYHRGHIPSEWCPEMSDLFSYCPVVVQPNNNKDDAPRRRKRFPWELT